MDKTLDNESVGWIGASLIPRFVETRNYGSAGIGIVKKKKKRCANSDEIARVNSGTERGKSSRVGSDRVGSGRVGSGRRLTGRSARHARQWRTENDRAKSWPNSDLYRKRPPLHPIPTVEKFLEVSTTLLPVSPDAIGIKTRVGGIFARRQRFPNDFEINF